jgi:succinate dehydrogenase/fumarate reductase flavoprotein subunit
MLQGQRAEAPAEALGQAGLRPTGRGAAPDPVSLIATAREQATHYDRTYFRTAETLTRALSVLDTQWRDLRAGLYAKGSDAVRAREAAAITATARWCLTAALHRRESRGMHTREDFPAINPAFSKRQVLHGLDKIDSHFAAQPELVA